MRVPWHIWAVGFLSLMWNSMGGFDYIMSQTENPDYLGMLTEPQRQFMANVPLWFDAAWAVGVWGSVLGSLMILMRARLAPLFFGLSLLGMLGTLVYALGIASPSALEINGSTGLAFSAAILAVLLFLLFYSRAMTRRGYLN